MKFFSKALLATTMKQAKIGCNVIISGKEIISVDACLEKEAGGYILTIRDRNRSKSVYETFELDVFQVAPQAADDKIKLKKSVGEETTLVIKHVKELASAEEFKKFQQKLESAISQQETAAEKLSDQRTLFNDIDEHKLLEEEIPEKQAPKVISRPITYGKNSKRYLDSIKTAFFGSPTYGPRVKIASSDSKPNYSSTPNLNKKSPSYSTQTTQTSIQQFWQPKSQPATTHGGFANYGNYCYMNAILQAFRGIAPFTTDLGNDELLQAKLPITSFYRSLLAIIDKTLQSDEKVVNPTKVKRAIGKHKDRFAGYAQQDAHEFFTSCLQQLEADLLPHLRTKRKKQGKMKLRYGDRATMMCPSSRNFNMVIKHTIECLECHDKSVVKELYNNLSVDIIPRDEFLAMKISRNPDWSEEKVEKFMQEVGEHPNIQHLFDMFLEDEDIEKKCEKCGHGRAVIQHRFHRLPRVLALHLKRFKQNLETQSYEKLHTPVPIKKALNLKQYCTGDTKAPIPFDTALIEANVKRSTKRLDATLKEERVVEEQKEKKRLASTLTPSESERPAKRQTIILPPNSEPSKVVSDAKKEDLDKVFRFTPDSQDDELKKALEESKKATSKEDLELLEAIRISLEEEKRLKMERGEDEVSGDEREQWGTSADNRWDEDTASASDEELEAFELQVTETAHDPEALEDSDDEDKKKPSKTGSSVPRDEPYRLVCVVHHGGSKMSNGHYVADILDQSGTWRCFNDALVKQILESFALGPERAKTGYMFFYVHSSCLPK